MSNIEIAIHFKLKATDKIKYVTLSKMTNISFVAEIEMPIRYLNRYKFDISTHLYQARCAADAAVVSIATGISSIPKCQLYTITIPTIIYHQLT